MAFHLKTRYKSIHRYKDDDRCTVEMPYAIGKPATTSMEKKEEASNLFVSVKE